MKQHIHFTTEFPDRAIARQRIKTVSAHMAAFILVTALTVTLFTACSPSSDNPSLPEDAATSDITPEYDGYSFYVPAADNSENASFDNDEASQVALQVGLSPEPLLTRLAEPLSTYEAPSCALVGMDILYTYSGYELTVYEGEDAAGSTFSTLSSIRLTDDSYTTAEGIYIGSTVTELTSVYGKAAPVSGEYCYEKGEMELSFLTRGGVVTSIEYRTQTE